jgi:hypothetical protein
MAMPAPQIAAAASAAGLTEVEVTRCGDKVIGPALRLTAARLAGPGTAPAGQRAAARLLTRQVDLLWPAGSSTTCYCARSGHDAAQAGRRRRPLPHVLRSSASSRWNCRGSGARQPG